MMTETAEAELPAAEAGETYRETPMRVITFSLAVAVLIIFVLNASVWQVHIRGPALLLAPVKDWRGILLVAIFLLALSLVTRRFWTAAAALMSLAGVMAVITVLKLRFLGEPLMPEDARYLTMPGFALSMVPWWVVPAALLVIAPLVVIGWRVDRRSTMLAGVGTSRVARSVALVVMCLLMIVAVTFNRPGNPLRFLYDHSGGWVPVNNTSNMLTAGYVGGFLAGMPMTAMVEPRGYDEEAVNRILDEYAARAASANAERTEGRRPNIVMVLSESFGDPTQVEGVSIDGDPLATYRELAAGTAHGSTRAAAFGTRTSTMEYQALTGHAVSLFTPPAFAPYQAFVPDYDTYPSMVSMLNDRGYDSVALHPFAGGSYQRDGVYETLGFDEFMDIDDFDDPQRIDKNPFISDETVFSEVRDRIDQSDAPVFAHVVTMQNHTPYTPPMYDDPFEVRRTDGKSDPSMGNWARGLAHSSEALRDLLQSLSASDEPTIVIYFGDHFPTGMETDLASQGDSTMETPALLWSNTEPGNGPVDFGTIGPQYLAPTLFDYVGEPEPAMYALLDRLRDEVGTPTSEGILDASGMKVAEEDLTAAQQRLLKQYRLVQYDLSIGHRYAKGMWKVPE